MRKNIFFVLFLRERLKACAENGKCRIVRCKRSRGGGQKSGFAVLGGGIFYPLPEQAAKIIIIGKPRPFRGRFQVFPLRDVIFCLSDLFVDHIIHDAFAHFLFEQDGAVDGGEIERIPDFFERDFFPDMAADIIFDLYGQGAEFFCMQIFGQLLYDALQEQIEASERVRVRQICIHFVACGKQ